MNSRSPTLYEPKRFFTFYLEILKQTICVYVHMRRDRKPQRREPLKTMNPEKQRIAIAEACGWTQFDNEWVAPSASALRTFTGTSDSSSRVYPPSYLNDLNAMHEAEKVLKSIDWSTYNRFLQQLSMRDRTDACHWNFHATAAQRAEALLRTLGKWEEGE